MAEFRPDRGVQQELTPAERALLRELEPVAARIVRDYFLPDGKVNAEVGARVRLQANVGRAEVRVAAQRKPGNAERRNEDVVKLDQDVPAYVVADGVSGKLRNVSALMGEVAAVTAMEQVRSLHGQEAPAEVIKRALARIPELSRLTLERALQNCDRPDLRRVVTPELHEGQKVYTVGDYSPTEFATTLDVVYYAAHLQEVFGLHVGNGRNFLVQPRKNQDPIIESLTFRHEDEDGSLQSCVALDKDSVTQADIFQRPALPGAFVVTVDDGVFAAYEARKGGQSFEGYLMAIDFPEPASTRSPDALGTIMAATQLQTEGTRDDGAAALMRLPK